jgi:hypothetical protein
MKHHFHLILFHFSILNSWNVVGHLDLQSFDANELCWWFRGLGAKP